MAILGTVVTVGCGTSTQKVARLDFPLPPRARYSVSDVEFEAARLTLQQHFSSDTNHLQKIVSLPCFCGPGLWRLVKDSTHFLVPPTAKTTCKVTMKNGRILELPAALLQSEAEVVNFRAALADLLCKNGTLTFRLPTEAEFKTFWTFIPFNEISNPLIVAEGTQHTFVVSFGKKKPFWFDELRNITIW